MGDERVLGPFITLARENCFSGACTAQKGVQQTPWNQVVGAVMSEQTHMINEASKC